MFRGMEYVYEVYKHKSFSKAAETMYISQPSLSATIKKIENRIGAPIFDRSTNPIQLTDCGREYIRSIEKIMGITTGFENYLQDLQDLKTGSLAIGASSFFSSYVLPPIIARYMQTYPLVNVDLIEASSPQLEKLLLNGTLDLILDNHDYGEGSFVKRYFSSEHMILAVPGSFASNKEVEEYQLTSEDIACGKHLDPATLSVPLQTFEDEPFILLKSGNDTRSRAERICHHNGITPNVILRLDQMATSYNIMCYGMGIAFVNDTLVKAVKPDPDVVYYKLAGPHTKRDVFLYCKQNRYVTRAMEEFQRIATE